EEDAERLAGREPPPSEVVGRSARLDPGRPEPLACRDRIFELERDREDALAARTEEQGRRHSLVSRLEQLAEAVLRPAHGVARAEARHVARALRAIEPDVRLVERERGLEVPDDENDRRDPRHLSSF